MKEPDSPCYGCDFEHEDKRNPQCENCEKRLQYAVDENMLPECVLEQEEDPVVEEVREAVAIKKSKDLECDEDKCHKTAKIKGKCRNCYQRAYYRAPHPKKEKKAMVKKEPKEVPVVEKKELVCDGEMKPGCKGEVKARGKCQNCYRAWIRKNSDVVGKYKKDPTKNRNQINLAFGNADSEARQIIREVNRIAVIEMRSLSTQALYFLRYGIARWKAEHPDG